MVTGFNEDVQVAGKVYHVQTEDKGRKNPVVETLVYIGGTGQILHKERFSYADSNDDSVYEEREVARLVEQQHQRIIRAIQAGAFDPDRRPFGEEFITDRSLDECILDFLAEQSKSQTLALSVVSESPYLPGEKAWLIIRATREGGATPVPDVVIRGRVIHTAGSPDPLAEARTDANGEARIEFDVPQGAGNAAVIVQGESAAHGQDEIRRLIC